MRKLACLKPIAVEALLRSGVGQTLLGTLILSGIICGIGIACGLAFGVLYSVILLITLASREFLYLVGAIVFISTLFALLMKLKKRHDLKKSTEFSELGNSIVRH